jgi:hypothetical protein
LQIGGRIPWEPLFNKAEQQSLSLMEMNEAHKSKAILKEIWFNLQRLIGQQS